MNISSIGLRKISFGSKANEETSHDQPQKKGTPFMKAQNGNYYNMNTAISIKEGEKKGSIAFFPMDLLLLGNGSQCSAKFDSSPEELIERIGYLA